MNSIISISHDQPYQPNFFNQTKRKQAKQKIFEQPICNTTNNHPAPREGEGTFYETSIDDLTTMLLRQHVVASLTPHCGVNDVTLGNACRRNQFTKNGRDRLMGWLKAGVRRVEALKDLHYNLANLAPPRNLSHFYQRQQHAAGL